MVVLVAGLAIVIKPSNPAPKTLTNSTQSGRTVASMPVSTQDTQPVTEKPVESVEVATSPVVTPEPVVAERPPEPAPISDKQSLMQQAGIPQNEWEATDYIVSHESSWNPSARNASGATGLCQALPASKMATAGSDYMTNPVTQLRWCHSYATQRYGGWWGSFAFWQANKWW